MTECYNRVLEHDSNRTFVYFVDMPLTRGIKEVVGSWAQHEKTLFLQRKDTRTSRYAVISQVVAVNRRKPTGTHNVGVHDSCGLLEVTRPTSIDWVRTARSMYFPDCPNRHQVEYAMRRWILPDLVTLCLAYVYDDWPGLDRLLCDCVAGDIQPCLELVKGRFINE